MSSGKEIGAFALGVTSMTLSPRPGGGRDVQMNLEGTVTGAWDAAVIMTMNISTEDLKNGTYSDTVVGFLADGTTISGDGVGTTQALGGNKWRVRGNALTSDGHTLSSDGEMDLTTRSYKEKLFE